MSVDMLCNTIAVFNKNLVDLSIIWLEIKDWVTKYIGVPKDFVFADPHWPGAGGHLDGAYAEGEWIKTILENQNHNVSLERHPVDKITFWNNLSHNYIIHLAGHGSYDYSTGQCYFCFDDQNVYPNDLKGLNYPPSKLFYAGVCRCGQNDTMAKVFIDQGTDMYVGFKENIGDWAAAEFDKLVYEKWLVDGKDLKTALDEADDLYQSGCETWVLWGSSV